MLTLRKVQRKDGKKEEGRKEGKKEEGKKEGKKEGAKMLTQLKGRHIFTIFLTYGLCKESP